MKPSDVLSVLQIINGVFQLVPFGAQTILGIKHLLAQDPAMAEGMQALLDFPPDMSRVPAEPNRLTNQTLVRTFEEEWGKVHD